MDAIFLFGCPVNKTRLTSFADSLPIKAMLLFLVLQVAFVLSNTVANCLPRSVIESHAQGSESSALLSDMYATTTVLQLVLFALITIALSLKSHSKRTKVLRLRR